MPHAIPQTHSAFYPNRLSYGLSIYGAVNAGFAQMKFFSLLVELIPYISFSRSTTVEEYHHIDLALASVVTKYQSNSLS